MPLPHGAAHTITQLLCAAPLPVLTHTGKYRRNMSGKLLKVSLLFTNCHFTRCCSQRWYSVLRSTPCCYGNRDTALVGCSLCDGVPEINPSVNLFALFKCLTNKKQTHHLLCRVDRGSQGCRQDSHMAGPNSGRFWHTPAPFHLNYTLNEQGEEGTGLTVALQTKVHYLDQIILNFCCIMRKNKRVTPKNMLTNKEVHDYK